ncbi:hypothetical protein LTR10_003464 [Elasticomyces elasticus]|nr:hypothetical protein LTR10_003464 [Elasticomyces elasticus]KAK4969732.1 hypothetical protein LTR42_009004 [Elasticomyces elasticus]
MSRRIASHSASEMWREAGQQLSGFWFNPKITPTMRSGEAERKPANFRKAYIDGVALCVPCRAAVQDDDFNRIGDPQWINDGFPGCEELEDPVMYCALCRHILRARELARRLGQSEKVPSVPLYWTFQHMGQSILIEEPVSDSCQADTTSLEGFFLAAHSLVRTVRFRQADLAWLSECLRQCETDHGSTCDSTEFKWFHAQGPPLLLVDVQKQCLARKPESSRYFALSYVWGKVEQFSTRTSNLEALMNPGSLSSQPITQTVADTMILLKNMGERYLWVDVLSVIQDDDEVKQAEINRMASIYSNAVATIVALSGETANSGLPGVGKSIRHAESILIAPGLRLAENMTLERALTDDIVEGLDRGFAYNTRAWTFQERLLSKRTLVFLPDQLYYQCRTVIVAEDRHANHPHSISDTSHFSLDKAKRLSMAGYTRNGVKEQRDNPRYEPLDDFRYYVELVGLYTAKHITYEGDILNAFTGIMSALRGLFEWQFAAGLPFGVDTMLDLALLWSPVDQLERRKAGDLFPSWSWAGWHGRVHYNDIFRPVEHTGSGAAQGMDKVALSQLFKSTVHWGDLSGFIPPHLRFSAKWTRIEGYHFSDANGTKGRLFNPFYNGPVTPNVSFIFDKASHRCGILYGTSAKLLEQYRHSDMKIILLSMWYRASAMGFFQPIIGFAKKDTAQEEGLFDDSFAQKPWMIYNILLVRPAGNHHERVAIGQIHSEAVGETREMCVSLA